MCIKIGWWIGLPTVFFCCSDCSDFLVCEMSWWYGLRLFFFLSKVFLLPFFFTKHLSCLEISSSNEQLNSDKFREKADGAAEVSKTQVIKKKKKKRVVVCICQIDQCVLRLRRTISQLKTSDVGIQHITPFFPPWLVSKMFISLPFYSLFIHFKSAHLVLSLRCTCVLNYSLYAQFRTVPLKKKKKMNHKSAP